MRDLSTTLVVLALILVGWYALNRWGLSVYPDDPSAGGEYTVIRWASDPNPARTEQMALFNRLYEDKKVRVILDPSADVQKILTQAAAGSGPDVFDIYSYATFALYASKGVMVELNDYMREAKLNLDDFWLHRRNALAVPVADAPAKADEYERFRHLRRPQQRHRQRHLSQPLALRRGRARTPSAKLGHAALAVEPLDLVGLCPSVSGPSPKRAPMADAMRPLARAGRVSAEG